MCFREKIIEKRVQGLLESFSDEEYGKLREKHIATFVELDENKVFGLMGGGYMSDGSSGEAMRASDYWINRMRQIRVCKPIEIFGFDDLR